MSTPLVSNALQYLGTPYTFGAPLGDTSRFDCSSLMYTIFKNSYDIDLPRTSKEQSLIGDEISFSDVGIGDLLFFDTLKKGEISHVGMVVKKDTDGIPVMIHANSVDNKVVEERVSGRYWKESYKIAKRLDSFITSTSSTKHISFLDIDKQYQFFKAILYFAKKGAIQYGATTSFHPYNYFSRGEFSKVLCISQKYAIQKNTTSIFPDTQNHFCRDYAYTLYKKGILQGYTDKTFRPNDPLLYPEICKILIKTYNISLIGDQRYDNVPQEHWFSQYQGTIKHYNLLPLSGNQFPLYQPIIRGNALEMMYRIETMV